MYQKINLILHIYQSVSLRGARFLVLLPTQHGHHRNPIRVRGGLSEATRVGVGVVVHQVKLSRIAEQEFFKSKFTFLNNKPTFIKKFFGRFFLKYIVTFEQTMIYISLTII